MIFDEIIVGAGIAGLYWIYKTKPQNFLILEKSNRIGGRIYDIEWHNNNISLGGGVIKSNNKYTINLTNQLNFELGSSISKYHFVDFENQTSKNKPNENDFYELNNIIIRYMKKIYKKNIKEINDKKLCFYEFLDLYLDNNIVQYIKSYLLYQTYNDGDVYSVLYNEMDELLRTKDFEIKFIKEKGYGSLINKLISIIGKKNIITNREVVMIKKQDQFFYQIFCIDKKIYNCKKIIIATETNNNILFDIDTKLSQQIKNLYNMFNPSNYIRVYTYHKNTHGLTCSYKTTGLAGKVIRINNNILMCCYTEGSNAVNLSYLLNKYDKEGQIDVIYRLLINSNINISKPDDIVIKFWNVGVHCNNPNYSLVEKKNILNKLKKENIYVIGEAVSDNHGWVNSSLESVEFYFSNN